MLLRFSLRLGLISALFLCWLRRAAWPPLTVSPVTTAPLSRSGSSMSRSAGAMRYLSQPPCRALQGLAPARGSQAVLYCHRSMAEESAAGGGAPAGSGRAMPGVPRSPRRGSAGLLKARRGGLPLLPHRSAQTVQVSPMRPMPRGSVPRAIMAHQSSNPALLVKEADKLCLSCHSPQSVQQKHPGYPAEVKNCGSCHSPHGSENRGLIRNVLHEPYAAGCKDCHVGKGVPVGIDTCLGCHDDVGEQMASSHNHSGALREKRLHGLPLPACRR